MMGERYYLKLTAVKLTPISNKTALGSRIPNGCNEIGSARYVTQGGTASGISLASVRW